MNAPSFFSPSIPASNSSITLYYADEKIDIENFDPQSYNSSQRLKMMLENPLAVIEYFRTMIETIIETSLKEGMFGEVAHHYDTTEYQGRYTPHIHMAIIDSVHIFMY